MSQTIMPYPPIPKSRKGEPTWEAAGFFPLQGYWTEEEYLRLPGSRLVEFSDGNLELLPMPTLNHQYIVVYLLEKLQLYLKKNPLGKAVVAPLPVQLWPGKWREPDIVFLKSERLKSKPKFPKGADHVMEVVSPDDPNRDWKKKRSEYAKAGISEYWIIDPSKKCIVVLVLEENTYKTHGRFEIGKAADSVQLMGFSVDVSEVFAVADLD